MNSATIIVVLIIVTVALLSMESYITWRVQADWRKLNNRRTTDYRYNDQPPGHLAALYGITPREALSISLALLEERPESDITKYPHPDTVFEAIRRRPGGFLVAPRPARRRKQG